MTTATNGNSEDASGSHNRLRMPQLVCFDLDYTLWPLWVDTHVSPPIKRKGTHDVNLVYDRRGSTMSFYEDVPEILQELKDNEDVQVAVASRTSAPDPAAQALDQLLIPASSSIKGNKAALMRALECFDTKEIYPGSKIRHFKEIHRKTGIPFEEMVFYDDESRNKEVSTLGVTFVLVPNGVNRRIFEKGIADWRRAREAQDKDEDGSSVFVERKKPRKSAKRGV